MAPDGDFEEVLGRRAAEFLHPEVLKDEQVDARELLHELPTRPRRVGFGEVGREIKGAADTRPVAGTDGAHGKRCRDVRFAHTGRTRDTMPIS